MKYSPAIFAVLISVSTVNARFGQQNPPVEGKLNGFGGSVSGEFAAKLSTFTQQLPKSLTAAPPACEQANLADQMLALSSQITDEGKKKEFIALVQEYMNAERNFNPDVPANGQGQPVFCDDPALPKAKELRGIIPLVDPASGKKGGKTGAQISELAKQILADAKSGKDVSGPAEGKSIQQQMLALGFTDCKGCKGGAAGGNNATASAAGGAGTPPPAGGAGTPPPAGGAGTPPPAGGAGTPPPAGGAGAPPPAGGAGTPPPAGGAGTPPPAGGQGGDAKAPGGGQGGQGGDAKKGKSCNDVPKGQLCTTSGALEMGDEATILADCDAFHKRCSEKSQNKGDCDNKLKECQDKVKNGDRNPNTAKITFGPI